MYLIGLTMFYDEVFFLPLWMENVLPQLDLALVLEGGSTDRTFDMLLECWRQNSEKVVLYRWPQVGEPYTALWDEVGRRNFLFSEARKRVEYFGIEEAYGVQVNADEVLDDDMRSKLVFHMAEKPEVVGFPVVHFWGDLQHVRISPSDGSDPVWTGQAGGGGPMVRLGCGLGYDRAAADYRGLHAGISRVEGRAPIRTVMAKDLHVFHLRWAFGEEGLKDYGDRMFDLGAWDRKVTWESHDLWDGDGKYLTRVCVEEFSSLGVEYPEVLRRSL